MTRTATALEKFSPVPVIEDRLRVCNLCGGEDTILGYEELNGQIDTIHFVKIELRYFERAEDKFDQAILRRLQRAKFHGPIVVNRRDAMERFTCVNCLNANERSRAIWGELKAQALKLERNQNSDENYYHLLCEVQDG